MQSSYKSQFIIHFNPPTLQSLQQIPLMKQNLLFVNQISNPNDYLDFHAMLSNDKIELKRMHLKSELKKQHTCIRKRGMHLKTIRKSIQ